VSAAEESEVRGALAEAKATIARLENDRREALRVLYAEREAREAAPYREGSAYSPKASEALTAPEIDALVAWFMYRIRSEERGALRADLPRVYAKLCAKLAISERFEVKP
jgi:hypothetical protein